LLQGNLAQSVQLDQVHQLVHWDTAWSLVSQRPTLPGPSTSAEHQPRSANLILQLAAQEFSARSSPFSRLAAPLTRVISPDELERVLVALAHAPDTDVLLRDVPYPAIMAPLVAPSEEQRNRAEAILRAHESQFKSLLHELDRVTQEQVLPSLKTGKVIPHQEVFRLGAADLGARPDVPPEVAEEILLLHEGNIASVALVGLLFTETPDWILSDIVTRGLRGLLALLKLLAAAGYQVNAEVLPEEERLQPLGASFEEMRRYREVEREEALKILEERRRLRGVA
jgi:LmbE family N-acetylglucosaminyl deacetylase